MDMPRTVSIGCQDFETIRREGYFYVDKTLFIKEWWELADRYVLTSNRESRFGRYDVMLDPKRGNEAADKTSADGVINDRFRDAIIMEFKVQNTENEAELSDTVRNALKQIDRQNYEATLVAKGIPRERIRKYGFTFCGKRVLIG